MLTFQDFFSACAGFWTTERTYHAVLQDEIERSYTEFRVTALEQVDKQPMLSAVVPTAGVFAGVKIDSVTSLAEPSHCPGFAIAFETLSETGEEVSMSLKALFVPDRFVDFSESTYEPIPLPIAAQVIDAPEDVIQGFYLRDEGYSEAGAIAGRFTYQTTRQTLEMLTYYRRSVALDQMRFVTPNLRLRTILTYQRPPAGEIPSIMTLVGFGLERKQA